MDQKPYLQIAIQKIENEIAGGLNVGALANVCFTSPNQLYRDFYALTGHSVKEYIRKRRLSKALSLVRHSSMRLTDIALECGYGTQQSFCKCVKAATGMTPLEYRAGDGIYYFPVFRGGRMRQVAIKTETIPPTLRMEYCHSQLRGIENRALARLFSALPEYTGRIFGRNGKQRGRRFCYELYIERPSIQIDPLKDGGFTGFADIPGATATFAKTSVNNNEDDIYSAWDYLYGDWLPASMFAPEQMPLFEEYHCRGNKTKKLTLYLPVRKRDDFDRINLRPCDEMMFLVSSKTGPRAEEEAAKEVLGYLYARYPILLRDTRQFYVAKRGPAYACGVRLGREVRLPPGGGLQILCHAKGKYAVYEGNCCGDSGVYESALRRWAEENGLAERGAETFTIYETDGGYERQNAGAKVYIRIKDGKNGQYGAD